MMICTTCEKFDCECISKHSSIQPEKQCVFCTYKTWMDPDNKIKKNRISSIANIKWESSRNSDHKGVDEVDFGDGDNAISFSDLPLKLKKEELDDAANDEFESACNRFFNE